MMRKFTHYTPSKQDIIAGLAIKDNNIEFIGAENQTVIFTQNGQAKPFKSLDVKIYKKLKDALFNDLEALKIIKHFFPEAQTTTRLVEIYTYYIYGSVDTTPDVIDGNLQPSENFRESENCISLQFSSKHITVNGIPLKRRYIKMIDAWAKGTPDKTIAADILDIALPTYDFHKSKLFKIIQVDSKPEAVSKAYKHQILCA